MENESKIPDGVSQPAHEWRPHTVSSNDVTENITEDVPVELAEGFMSEDLTRPRFDMDADENMLMFRVRRMLHNDDYKRIFQNPRVGEM